MKMESANLRDGRVKSSDESLPRRPVSAENRKIFDTATRWRTIIVLALLASPSISIQAGQWIPIDGHGIPQQKDPLGKDKNVDPDAARIHKQQLKAMNQQRQRQMISDTEKLLQIARELRAEVSDSDTHALPQAVIRKTGQIEKLSRSVREKMNAIQ